MKILNFEEYKELVESTEPVDAEELELFIVNDGDLYRQRTSAIINNYRKKFAKNSYDSELAAKGYMKVVDDGAKKYAQKFGEGKKWNIMFPKNIRLEVATALEKKYKEEVEYKEDIKEGVNPNLKYPVGNHYNIAHDALKADVTANGVEDGKFVAQGSISKKELEAQDKKGNKVYTEKGKKYIDIPYKEYTQMRKRFDAEKDEYIEKNNLIKK